MCYNDKQLEALRNIHAQLDEGYLDISDIHEEEEINMIRHSLNTLVAVEQFRWERDIAVMQLNDLGVGFGESTDNYVCLPKKKYDELLEYKLMYENLCR